jgi:hypothetical protein
MNRCAALGCLLWLSVGTAPTPATAQEGLVTRNTPTGSVVGYLDTPLMPWTDNKYHVHDPDRPLPPVVLPRSPHDPLPAAPAPSDAVVLFDGKTTDRFTTSSWTVENGALQAGHESLVTREAFGNCQLHVEFMTPTTPPDHFMNRGNSGVLLMGKYEVQIFDSWHEHPQQIYADGQAAAIYGQTPPLVNACLPPGVWQSFDIVFTAPLFEGQKLAKPATLTLFHNGVLVHCHQPIWGEMAHRQIVPCTPHPAQLPLVLQGHGSPIQFRNIWIRPLAP